MRLYLYVVYHRRHKTPHPYERTNERTNKQPRTCSLGAFRRLAAGARARVNASTLGTSADRCSGGSMTRQRDKSFCPFVSSSTVESTLRSREASRVDASGAGFPSALRGHGAEGGGYGGVEREKGGRKYWGGKGTVTARARRERVSHQADCGTCVRVGFSEGAT